MKICVFGAASYEIDRKYFDNTRSLCERLAKNGHDLVFGAGGNGLMGAAAEGFKSGGGKIYGVIPEFFREGRIERIYPDCTELFFTETMAQRKAKMEEMADVFLIVPGGIGTFEEFFEVLTLKQLARHTKPIAIYNINSYFDDLIKFLDFSYKEKFIRESCHTLYFISDDLQAIEDYIENDERELHSVHEMKKG